MPHRHIIGPTVNFWADNRDVNLKNQVLLRGKG